jgi:hypothetical protein
VYVSFSSSTFISSFSFSSKFFTSDIKFPSTCNHCSLNNPKYDVSILAENLIESTGDKVQLVITSIFKFSKFDISPFLVFSISYLTFKTGEKFASISNTLTSSSTSFKSSILLYQTFFSTLISISISNQSLSICVIYKSLFKIFIPLEASISPAFTTQAVFLFNLIHSIPSSFFSTTKSFRFNIISSILSLTPGKFEYS